MSEHKEQPVDELDQALVTALRERAEIAETDKKITVEDNIRLMNEAERLQADLASARQALDVLNERQRVEWARAETAEARAERLERALRSWAKSQEEPEGELCWCSEGEALSAMAPADHATACIRAREALRPAKETT